MKTRIRSVDSFSAKPSVKTPKAEIFMEDSLQNLLTGLGIDGMDKKTGAHFKDVDLEYHELEAAYSTDWLSGKVCDIPPFDMTRAWRTFQGSMEPQELLDFNLVEKDFRVREKIHEALVLSRIYGGSGIIMNVDDGMEPWEPINMDAIGLGDLRWMIVSDSQYFKASRFEYNPFEKNYGYPSHYRLAPSSIEIHHSRVIRFEGVPLPLAARRRNQYWGKSIIERLHSALLNASSVQENVGVLIYEASVDILKIPDLMEKVADEKQRLALSKRFGIAKLQKSVNRMLLLDIEEEYETTQQNFAGLKDMMQQYLNIVAGAADIPITRLLGQSPGGLSATGESDIRNYYDFISGQQECTLRPRLERIDEILYRSTFGKPPPKEMLSFKFNTLWQMTEMESSTVQSSVATRDSAYLDRGVVPESIIAKELMLNKTYSGITPEYIKELEEFEEEEEEEEENEINGDPSNNPNNGNGGDGDDSGDDNNGGDDSGNGNN